MYNYSLYHIVNKNILFNGIVTLMNKYINIIWCHIKKRASGYV